MKEEKRVITLDGYEHGVMVNDLLLKTIDAPTKKQKSRNHDETR